MARCCWCRPWPRPWRGPSEGFTATTVSHRLRPSTSLVTTAREADSSSTGQTLERTPGRRQGKRGTHHGSRRASLRARMRGKAACKSSQKKRNGDYRCTIRTPDAHAADTVMHSSRLISSRYCGDAPEKPTCCPCRTRVKPRQSSCKMHKNKLLMLETCSRG